ncbi:MAG: beta-L-arabinofuranosidase domain-containing protein, partial [Bacteroidota bacterium]
MKLFLLSFIMVFSITYGNKEKISEPGLPFYGKFKEIPANAITPKGWLKQFLLNQRDGLTGHLEKAGYPFNTVGWAADSIPRNRSIEKWWPYEQNGYWVDGMLRCGLLLNDTMLLNKARKSIYYVLNHPDPSGFLGPLFMKPSYERDRWAYVVFFRAWMAEYAATKNQKLLEAIKRHYLSDRFPYTNNRESVNSEIILWAYAQSGDTALLHFAQDIYRNSNELNSKTVVSDISFLKDTAATGEHGVTFLEKAKLGAILYMYTGKKDYLQPSIAAFKKLDKYHMLVDGVNVSSEHLENVTTQESHEICDISDFIWNAGYLLMATGDASYADKIEKAAFNAAPGSVTKNFTALQYFSAPNQVIAARGSFIRGGGDQMRYAPNPGTECCPGNVNRMMPNFAIHSWMSDSHGGIVATTYAPSSVTYPVGKENTIVTIDEDTRYPFSDNIDFTFHLKEKTAFTFYIRIPQWCKNARVLINNKAVNTALKPGTYVPLKREYKEGDKIAITLPSEVSLTHGVEKGITVVRGPLVYALKIE